MASTRKRIAGKPVAKRADVAEKICCAPVTETSEPRLNSFYCAGDRIPLKSVGRVVVCLKDGTEDVLSHGVRVPVDIDGFVLLDPETREMKYVPGKQAPVDIAGTVQQLLDAHDFGNAGIDEAAAESIAKATFLACFDENINKELIAGYVAKCLLDAGIPTSGEIAAQVNAAVAEIDIPDAAYIKGLIEECQRSEEAIRLIIQTEMAQAGLINEATVNLLAKTVATACFSDLIQDYLTAAEIQALIQAAFNGGESFSEVDIRVFAKAEAQACLNAYPFKALIESCIENADISTVSEIEAIAKIQAQACLDAYPFKTLVDACIENSQIITPAEVEEIAKAEAQECIDNYPFKALIEKCIEGADISSVEEIEVIAKEQAQNCIALYPFKVMVENCLETAGISTVGEIEVIAKGQAQQCIADAGIPDQQIIEAWAKAVALVCIQAELENRYLPTQEELIELIKATTFECLKEILELEAKTSICFEYGGPTYEQDENGKITIIDCLKADGWNGSCETASYDPDTGCRTIPYTGPTQEQIEQIVTTVHAELSAADNDAFCIQSINADYNSATGQFTMSVTDQCGTKSDTAVFPINTGGTTVGGITLADAKNQAQACINDSSNNARFCNSAFSLDLVGTTLNAIITDSCGSQSSSADLSSLGGGGGGLAYCLSDATLSYAGSTLSLQIEQDNCTDTLASVVLPIVDGGTVECCNTGFSTTNFNPDTCVITATLNQSSGDPVSMVIPLSDYITSTVLTAADGCTQYNSVRIGNKELFRAPLFVEATEECVRMCVENYTGNQTVGPLDVDVVITMPEINYTYLLTAGNTFDYFAETGINLNDYTGPIDICVDNACDNDLFLSLQNIPATPAHKCC